MYRSLVSSLYKVLYDMCQKVSGKGCTPPSSGIGPMPILAPNPTPRAPGPGTAPIPNPGGTGIGGDLYRIWCHRVNGRSLRNLLISGWYCVRGNRWHCWRLGMTLTW